MCAWAAISPFVKGGQAESLLQCLCSEQLLPPGFSQAHVWISCQTDLDVTRASYGDILMMQAILVDDTYVNLKGVMCVMYQ